MATEAEKKATHLAIYTDGGYRPSRGIGGWGLHGYLFREEPAKQGAGAKNALPTAQGYLMGQGGIPEITLTHYVDGFGPLPAPTTNNRAEIMGALKALDVAKQQEVLNITFLMDSQYVLESMSARLSGWAANNWLRNDGGEVKNADLWKQVHEVKADLEGAGVTMTYKWVKGHNGDLGNELADQNATRGTVVASNGNDLEIIQVGEAKGYWSYKPERSRFFSHPHWFFAPGAVESYTTTDGRHVYYLGDPREEIDLFGKKIANATFSILYLKSPDPVLSTIRDAAASMGADQYQGVHRGDLREIFSAGVYEELESFGNATLTKDFEHHRLSASNGRLLTTEVRPARLIYNAIDVFHALETMLKAYLDEGKGQQLRSTDLTSLFYESDTSKSKPVVKLKPHITSALRSMNVEAGYATAEGGTEKTTIVLTLGLDLPDRNTLAALAGELTKVTLITWPESARAVRYATVVEADGDVGIWSGVYANLHLLPS